MARRGPGIADHSSPSRRRPRSMSQEHGRRNSCGRRILKVCPIRYTRHPFLTHPHVTAVLRGSILLLPRVSYTLLSAEPRLCTWVLVPFLYSVVHLRLCSHLRTRGGIYVVSRLFRLHTPFLRHSLFRIPQHDHCLPGPN